MNNMKRSLFTFWSGTNLFQILFICTVFILAGCAAPEQPRQVLDFNNDWMFHLGDLEFDESPVFDDSDWRLLNVPHDWSIEGEFSPEHPAGTGGGALPGGVGWYQKTFTADEADRDKNFFIEFDGVYENSDVWINGNHLGNRPFGYVSFRYDLTDYIRNGQENTITVRVDNSNQPNSRWYSGSGIYRNVRMVITNPVHVDQWGTFITTPEISEEQALVDVETRLRNNTDVHREVTIQTDILDNRGRSVAKQTHSGIEIAPGESSIATKQVNISRPALWSVDTPNLYKAITTVLQDGQVVDNYETTFGIRDFHFDSVEGFFLNGEHVKIQGVCNHHDLGALGAAVNRRALERQLEIMRGMGVNAIRTAHNPPAPELLELADEMGFIIQNEAFDVWKKGKAEYDYSVHFEQWHERDLRDFVLRDRNHPSVIMWSIGNEILEQWDESGTQIAKDLATIVRDLDDTRPITAGKNDPQPGNYLIQSGEMDLIGYNYKHEDFENFPEVFPGGIFIGAETTSALATRGYYDMPSDSIRRWPYDWREAFTDGNPDHTVSAYDNVSTPWGSTHIESLRPVMNNDFLSGMFVWTGFDYLGEPTPYGWPSRSSFFGIVDLAGFPKDAYFLYKSVWTDEPVLHIFPHWNWEPGQTIDVWAYTNYDEVELFINGESQGNKEFDPDEMHIMWRVEYQPGTVKAIGRNHDGSEKIQEIHTAGEPHSIQLKADRTEIFADGSDLSFLTADIVDAEGNLVPDADNLISFELDGPGFVRAVDNGNPNSHEPFVADYRKAFNGKALAIIQSEKQTGILTVTATADGLESAEVTLSVR